MNCTTFNTITCSLFTELSKHNNPNPKPTQLFILNIESKTKTKLSLKCNHNYNQSCSDLNLNSTSSKINNNNNKKLNLSVPCFAVTETPVRTTSTEVVSDRLQRLVTEFEALTEPIERVKRLLDYAGRLPPLDESARLPANRVTGCTTQVWLEARMDETGRMRFRADSDSEITKGFISCLIWLLDGAEAEEVLAVKAEDLSVINVGPHGKAQSRVNTWHNVLISMQKRTIDLVTEPLASLVVDGIGANGRFVEALRQHSRRKKLDAKLSRS